MPGDTPALPFWSATSAWLEAPGRTTGPAWLPGFLAAMTDAAQRAGQGLSRLQAAAALALRLPVLTARGLADRRLRLPAPTPILEGP